MDDFTKRMLERAQSRQKQLEDQLNDVGLKTKAPLVESNSSLNLDFASKQNLSRRKDIVSESNLKENKIRTKTNEYKSDSALHLKRESVSDSDLARKNVSIKSEMNSQNSSKASLTRVSSDMGAGSPQSPNPKTLNIQRDDFNMEIRVTSRDDVKVHVEIEEREENSDDDDDDSESSSKSNGSCIREGARSRLQRLGKLYSGSDEAGLSSPIHRTEEKFYRDMSEQNEECQTRQPTKPKLRLAALANTINQWEDDLSHPTPIKKQAEQSISPSKKIGKGPAPKPPVVEKSATGAIPKKYLKPTAPKPPVANEKSPTKQLTWDKNVLDSLESQGFTRTESSTRLVFNCNQLSESEMNKRETLVEEDERNMVSTPSKSFNDSEVENDTSPIKKVTKIASKFQNDTQNHDKPSVSKNNTTKNSDVKLSPVKSPVKNFKTSSSILSKASIFENASPTRTKDPALLSVSERKALFEKNKGEALIPKAAFAMSIPSSSQAKNNSKNASNITTPTEKKTIVETPVVRPTTSASESSGIASKLQQLLQQATTISETQILKARQQEKQRELDMLKNRFNRNKETSEMSARQEGNESDSESESEADETTKMISNRKPEKIVTFASPNRSTSKTSIIPTAPPLPLIDEPKEAALRTPILKRRSGDSPKVQSVLEEVKRIKVSPSKDGRLYPCLSDIEATTTEAEETDENNTSLQKDDDDSSVYEEDESSIASESGDTSFGREILQAVCRNQAISAQREKRPILDSSTCSSLSDVLNDMNDYLDDQQSSSDTSAQDGPTPPKHFKVSSAKNSPMPSHSFHYKRGSTDSTPVRSSKKKSGSTPTKKTPTVETELPTHIIDGDTQVPLMHTVSFYRKQQTQQQTPTPGVKQIIRQPSVAEESSDNNFSDSEDEAALVEEKIQQLMDEISKQQAVISQSSQALNLCSATFEFSGSKEEVEAERLLLLATHRRQAALNELQRLKYERTLRPGKRFDPAYKKHINERGTLTISGIMIPLKRDYIRALTAAGGLGHYLLCLVRCDEQVLASQLVSTGNPPNPPKISVCIPGHLTLSSVYADFTCTLEIYSLQAHEEVLPHDIKYHIAAKKGGKMTPKKIKESKLVKPSIQSPAGPNAVRTSSFVLVGYVVFSIREISRNQWTLQQKMPAANPLDGIIQMNVQCQFSVSAEIKGFLTMFEDVSGFGAWHRRWCKLKGSMISYWKYPDDEKKKAPIGSISLQGCITQNVSRVREDICARRNTFMLEFKRKTQPGDTNSLVMICNGGTTTIRHLISTDTKEELIQWCEQLNKSLSAMRLWGSTEK